MARKRLKSFVACDPVSGRGIWVHPGDPLPDFLVEDELNPALFAQGDQVEEEDLNLETMTVRELIALANKRGVELVATRKADIIAAIRSLDDEDADDE